eukprot:TRINITY_DN17954_c0_g1_i1.p1 TRINITY_DN17954_c0_g1~~TRINITY_DN17954_c0_g1_i1.p1  ORF type:complete len:179 (-),score=10.62 TRINITY_DN17954_c0_g1_i1:50-586(-)
MSVISEITGSLSRMQTRQIIEQLIMFGLIVSTALMIWKSLMVISGSESPIVVVLSGSMEPAFQRGDLLFLYQSDGPFRVGDIVVFKIDGREIPIVHRALEIHEKANGKFDILTKGDNNQVHDRGLYNGLTWLNREHIMGRAAGYLPYIGMITIWMNDYPILKWALIGILGLFVVVNRE